MSSKRNNFKPVSFLAAFVFVLTSFLHPLIARADDIVTRRIQIGSAYPSDTTTHQFIFTTVTADNVGSIEFEYCSNSPLFDDPCVAPVGLDVAGATLTNQTGLNGFAISPATNANTLVISRAPAFANPSNVSYLFDAIVNPSTNDSYNFVRITVYDNVDATGAAVDQGAVVFVIQDGYNVDAYVPPYLTFCVAVSVALDCSSATGSLASFGEFSEFSPTTVTTQMSASTNDPTGYNIYVNGTTMTSGNNIIPALATQTASQPGVSQYGINLRANTNPAVGSNPSAGPVASGAPDTDYNTPNQFRFVDGDRVAGSSVSTGYNRYTVSYIVNVNENQAAGIYATTVLYTAIASF